MYQPVRPKSAKGKTRPTRVINSTSNNNEASTSNSPSTRQRGHNTQGRSQPTMGSRRISSDASNEVHFPEITRPPSSLSKYRVLPGIPTTPDGGEGAFPANNDVDWLTEQAQQLLLDSALQRHTKPKSPHVPNKSPTKRSAVANADVESKRKKVYQAQSIFTPA
uniref:Uncharacterized protein n=1 Tax=Ciona savignyi TaxID=51511 RepID=H2ZF84_CIOSA